MKKFVLFFLFVCVPMFASMKGGVSMTLSERQLCDVELLMNRGFAPLKGFMTQADYERVVQEMRLLDGTLWPIPIVLDVDEKIRQKIGSGALLDLCDSEGTVIARMEVEEIWAPDKTEEAKRVYGTTSRKHPGVSYLFDKTSEPDS